MNKLAEIKARKEELRKLLGGTEQVDLDEIQKELNDLDAEETWSLIHISEPTRPY